jgi:hypothetical protein
MLIRLSMFGDTLTYIDKFYWSIESLSCDFSQLRLYCCLVKKFFTMNFSFLRSFSIIEMI